MTLIEPYMQLRKKELQHTEPIFLATLVALHLTPVSNSVSRSFGLA